MCTRPADINKAEPCMESFFKHWAELHSKTTGCITDSTCVVNLKKKPIMLLPINTYEKYVHFTQTLLYVYLS